MEAIATLFVMKTTLGGYGLNIGIQGIVLDLLCYLWALWCFELPVLLGRLYKEDLLGQLVINPPDYVLPRTKHRVGVFVLLSSLIGSLALLRFNI